MENLVQKGLTFKGTYCNEEMIRVGFMSGLIQQLSSISKDLV